MIPCSCSGAIEGVQYGRFSLASASESGYCRDMDINEIRCRINDNCRAGRATFEGLSTAEVAEYHRAAMFGDLDEAFPGEYSEWAKVVD